MIGLVLMLSVKNPEKLERGSLPKSRFDHEGGKIGSGNSNHWRLHNYAGTIKNTHCEVRYISENFCLIEREGDVYINMLHDALGTDMAVALSHGDILKIGDYEILCEISTEKAVGAADIDIDELLGDVSKHLLSDDTSVDTSVIAAPVQAADTLLQAEPYNIQMDPLPAFEKHSGLAKEEQLIPIHNLGLSLTEFSGPDLSQTSVEAIAIRLDTGKAVVTEKSQNRTSASPDNTEKSKNNKQVPE